MAQCVPESRKVVILLEDLLGGDVPFSEATDAADATESGCFACLCHNPAGEVVAAFVADTRAAAFLGGKLMLLPVGRLEEAVATGQLDEELTDALSEVFNNLTVPVNAIDSNTHIASRPVAPFAQLMKEEDGEWLASPAARLDFKGSVLGGEGHFAMLFR